MIAERVEEEASQDGCGERDESSEGRQLPGEGSPLLRGRHCHQHRLLCRDPRGYRDSEEDREKNEVRKVAREVPSHEEEDGEGLGEGERFLRAEAEEHPGCGILGGDNGEVVVGHHEVATHPGQAVHPGVGVARSGVQDCRHGMGAYARAHPRR